MVWTRGRRIAVLVAAVGCCAIAACADNGAVPQSRASSPHKTAATGPATTPATTPAGYIADRIDIGGGRKLYLECTGTGSPTVVMEAGDEDGASGWRLVVPGLIKEARVCTYDRLGVGQSDAASGCRTMKDLRGDLEALLRTARVDPPYVLVGTSGGGYLVAGYAQAHPEHVKGLVFVETFPAIDLSKAPPELVAELKCDHESNVERRSYAVVEREAWDRRSKLGDFPLTVITNNYGAAATNDDERNNVVRQRGWYALSPAKASQVVVESGHDVPGNEPDVVVEAILKVLAASRQG